MVFETVISSPPTTPLKLKLAGVKLGVLALVSYSLVTPTTLTVMSFAVMVPIAPVTEAALLIV